MATSAYGAAADHAGLTGNDQGDPHTQYLTAARGDARYAPTGHVIVKRKTVAQSVSASTAGVADNALFFPVGAGESWVFEITLFVNGPDAGDISVGIAGTVENGTLRLGGVGMAQAEVSPAQATTNTRHVSSFYPGVGGSGMLYFGTQQFDQSTILLTGSIAASTATTLTLVWAQINSHASSLTVAVGSYLIARKVA